MWRQKGDAPPFHPMVWLLSRESQAKRQHAYFSQLILKADRSFRISEMTETSAMRRRNSRVLERNGTPSWIHIELCAWRQSRISNAS